MTAEFTFYVLFLMLTISMGVIFQFGLGRIKKLQKDIKKMNESIVILHSHVNKSSEAVKNIKTSMHRPVFRKGKTIKGDLELEYYGRSAQTKAIFHID